MGTMSQLPVGKPLQVTFGVVRNVGLINVCVTMHDASERVVASGKTSVQTNASSANRVLTGSLNIVNVPTTISSATRYELESTLAYKEEHYYWDTNATTVPNQLSQLTALLNITLQESTRTIGYTWGASALGLSNCAGQAMLATFTVMSTSISTALAPRGLAGSMPAGGSLDGGPLQAGAIITAPVVLIAVTGGASAALMAGSGTLIGQVSESRGQAAGAVATDIMRPK